MLLGYCLNFSLYQGSDPFIDAHYITSFGKLLSPLIHFVNDLKYKELPYRFFQDNAFTSQLWLDYCRSKNYYSTGTIRKNRLPKGTTFSSALKSRGDFSYQHSASGQMIVCKWKDNKEVFVASNCYGVFNENNETEMPLRWSKEKNKKVKVSQPYLIAKYNKSMGGTDRMNQNVNAYRIGIRSKKYYWTLFTWILDVSIQNSWILYKQYSEESKITLYEFKRRLANHYCLLSKAPSQREANLSHFSNGSSVPNETRFDSVDHWPGKYQMRSTEGKPQVQIRNRCKMSKCNKFSAIYCEKCNVALCINPCFKMFHNSQ